MRDAEQTARLFRVLSVGAHVRILQLLKQGVLCVGARAGRGKVVMWVAIVAAALILLSASGIVDRIYDHFAERPFREAVSRAPLVQVVYYAVLGTHGGVPDARTLEADFARIMCQLGDPHGREYVVAEVEGQTYLAELPRSENDVICIVREDAYLWCADKSHPVRRDVLQEAAPAYE